jgi:hypothetical protein
METNVKKDFEQPYSRKIMGLERRFPMKVLNFP